MRKKVLINHKVDWSESFVDPDGSFYCGATEEQKENAARIASIADLVIEHTDLHPQNAPEFSVNGGMYPLHNAILPKRYAPESVYHKDVQDSYALEGRKVSPRITEKIREVLHERTAAIIAPRGLYFQGESEEAVFSPSDVEETFDARIATTSEFLNGSIDYVIAPKHYFDASRTDSDVALPPTHVDGIPDTSYNVCSLLAKKYPAHEYERIHVVDGVVDSICKLHTAAGLRQMFPRDKVIAASDATTPLHGIGLGFETAEQSYSAIQRVCTDIGIMHMTTEEILEEAR